MRSLSLEADNWVLESQAQESGPSVGEGEPMGIQGFELGIQGFELGEAA